MHSTTISVGLIALCFHIAIALNYHPYSPPGQQIDIARLTSLPALIDQSTLTAGLTPEQLSSLSDASCNNASESQPNPIYTDYPDQITGTINATYFIVPISFAQARKVIPAKYPILTDQIKQFWPDAEHDKYPVYLT